MLMDTLQSAPRHDRISASAASGINMHNTTRRWCSILLIAGGLCTGAHAASPGVPPAPITISYSEATDLFNLLDNLSNWLPGYTAPVYRTYWEQRVGLDDADRAALASYAEFRQRTSGLASTNEIAAVDRLFAPDATRDSDAFSSYFLGGSTFEAAANAAIAAQSVDDQAMLRDYYARFMPRATRLITVRSRFGTQERTIEAELADPRVAQLAAEIRTFFRVPPPSVFEAKFVWWPDPDSTQAKVRGRTILLYSQHDVDGGAMSMDWVPILLHELSHYLSSSQPATRKQELGAEFVRLCPSATDMRNPLNALEEPLAIYWGQYRFEHDVRGGELSPSSEWYVQPDADRAAKAIATAFPATRSPPTLEDPALLVAAASACSR